jgi:hypothetical protein
MKISGLSIGLTTGAVGARQPDASRETASEIAGSGRIFIREAYTIQT